MDRLSWKMTWKHYTDCFCHVKSMVTHMHDTKTSNADAQVLKYVDALMRENSFIGGLGFSITVTAFASILCVVDPRKYFNKPLFVARVAVACATLYNFNKVHDTGCHLGMLIGMPKVFDVLLSGSSEEMKQRTTEFLSSLD